MNLIIKRIILASVFLLPFMIFTKGFYGAVFAKYVLIILTTLLVGTLFIIGRLYKDKIGVIPKNIAVGSLCLYVLVILISGLNGVLPSLSLWSTFDQSTGVIFMFFLLLFTIITSSVFKDLEDWYKLFAVFTLSGILFTIGGWLSVAGVNFSKYIDLAIHSGFTIGNSSWVGIYITFVLFIGLGLALSSKNKIYRIIGITGGVLAFFDPTLTGFLIQFPGMNFGPIGLAQTGSYSVFVSFALFFLYLIYRKIRLEKTRKIFLISFASLVSVVVLSVSIFGLNSIKNIISEKAGPNRIVFWDISVKGWQDKPLLGWGSDTYSFVYGKYFNPAVIIPGARSEYWVDKSHSIYFDEIVTGGVVGFLSLMFLYGIILYGLARKAINNLGREGLFYMALFVSVISFLIQGIMLFQTIIGWFIVALIVAFVSNLCFKDKYNDVIVKNNKINKNSTNDKSSNLIFSFFLIIIFFVLLNYIIIKPYQINIGLSEFPKMSYSQRIEFYKELNNSYVGNTNDLGNAFSNYHIKLRRILKNGLKQEEKQLMINEIKTINKVLDNGLKKEKYMDMKLLMTSVGFYSILIGIVPEEERLVHYNEGKFYVEKMKLISDKNPIVKLSESILNISLKYGEDGVNAFDVEKKNN